MSLQSVSNEVRDVIQLKGFENIVKRSKSHGVDSRSRRAKSGHDDYGYLRVISLNLFEYIESIEVRQFIVKKDKIGFPFANDIQGFPSAMTRDDLVSLLGQRLRQKMA